MTALAKDRKTDQFGTPDVLNPTDRSFPVAATTSIWGGGMVATDASGNAVPASASTALKVWGIAGRQAINTVAAGFGTAGDIQVQVKLGCFYLANSAGADIIAADDVGKLCYVADDQTVAATNGAGLRPAAGVVQGVRADGQVAVLLGQPSLYDEDDFADAPIALKAVFAKNILNANVADLAAYTVAANASNNDNIAGVEGDIVLAIAQTTVAQNGLYRVGVVAAGVAPLTRVSPMPAGYVFVADEFEIAIGQGAVYAHSKWFNSAGGTVGTNTPAFMPEKVTQSVAFPVNTGLIAITNVPVLSTTKTQLAAINIAEVTADLTVRYSRQPGTVVAGPLGTSTITVMAEIAAGGVNVDDDSTMLVTVSNR